MFFFLDDPLDDEIQTLKYDQISDFMMNTVRDKREDEIKDIQEEIKEGQRDEMLASNKDCNFGSYKSTSNMYYDSQNESQFDSKDRSTKLPALNKLETKRNKGKERSKLSRDRKKQYFNELETRIKDLEKENLRLHNLVQMYRRKSWKETDNKSAEMIEEIETNQRRGLSGFVDTEKDTYNEGTKLKVADVFKEKVYKLVQKHQNMLNSNFEMILSHLYPMPQIGNFYEHIDTGFSKSFEEIKKFTKLTKYQMPEYIKEHNFKMFDVICASFDPNKRQYNFIKDVMFVKEAGFKAKFGEAFEKIIEAQNI